MKEKLYCVDIFNITEKKAFLEIKKVKFTKSIRTIWFYSTFENIKLVSQVFVIYFDHQIHCEDP